jgi:hypothetical protein
MHGRPIVRHSAPLRLTPRDWEILDALSLRVRILGLSQIAWNWWSDTESPQSAARERLDRLVARGWLLRTRALAQQLSPFVVPQAMWSSGQWVPEFGSIAWRLRRRWAGPAAIVTVYLATSRTARHFGGRRRDHIARPFQMAHDLGTAEMFLAVRRQRPELVRLWIDEDRLAPFRRRQKLPDAVIAASPSAPIELVLEFGAGYSKQRLAAFHRDNEARGLPYEIW